MKQFISFTRKEFIHIFPDSRTLLILLVMPAVLITLFGYVVTTEVRGAIATICDEAMTQDSRIVEAISASQYFSLTSPCGSTDAAEDKLRSGEADVAVCINRDGNVLILCDIIASGETLVNCLRYVTDFYRDHGAKLRNIVLFTIGGGKGIELLERLTAEIREYWPDFEGFITVYYEGIFSCYEEGDKGVSGINRANIDFYWKDGIIAPAYRRETLTIWVRRWNLSRRI